VARRGERDRDLPAEAAARHGRTGPVLIGLTAAFAFGAVDQYLQVVIPAGHLSASLFAVQVSSMSAPWLLVPFLAGAWQGSQRRAALVGLAATWLAVLAYILMIISPMEGSHLGAPPPGWHGSYNQLTLHMFAATLASQWLWFAGGLITGPLYGWLGYRWRARQSTAAALLAALPVLLEPAAVWLASRLNLGILGFAHFWWPDQPGGVAAEFAELAVGLLLTAAVVKVVAGGRASASA
jgi:hypothetical protein